MSRKRKRLSRSKSGHRSKQLCLDDLRLDIPQVQLQNLRISSSQQPPFRRPPMISPFSIDNAVPAFGSQSTTTFLGLWNPVRQFSRKRKLSSDDDAELELQIQQKKARLSSNSFNSNNNNLQPVILSSKNINRRKRRLEALEEDEQEFNNNHNNSNSSKKRKMDIDTESSSNTFQPIQRNIRTNQGTKRKNKNENLFNIKRRRTNEGISLAVLNQDGEA